MVIDNFNLGGSKIGPGKAEPELVINPNAVVPGTVSRKCLESVTKRGAQKVQGGRTIELLQFSFGNRGDVGKPCNTTTFEERLRVFEVERSNDGSS